MVAFIFLGLMLGVIARTLRGGWQAPQVTATVGAGLLGSLAGGIITNLVMDDAWDAMGWTSVVVALVAALALISVVELSSGG